MAKQTSTNSVSYWFKWLTDDTLHAMHRDLLINGVFDDGDEGRMTTAVLHTIEREAGVRALQRSVKV